jgi:hypothetical protein
MRRSRAEGRAARARRPKQEEGPGAETEEYGIRITGNMKLTIGEKKL